MIKIIGIIILIISGVSGGFAASEKYSRKVNFLRQYVNLILNLKTEIKYSLKPLGEILENHYCTEPLKSCLAVCVNHLKENSLETSWKKAFENSLQEAGLSKEEMSVITELGGELGVCDIEGQANYLDHNLNIMNAYLAQAIENRKAKGKLPVILGTGLSISAALLFI